MKRILVGFILWISIFSVKGSQISETEAQQNDNFFRSKQPLKKMEIRRSQQEMQNVKKGHEGNQRQVRYNDQSDLDIESQETKRRRLFSLQQSFELHFRYPYQITHLVLVDMQYFKYSLDQCDPPLEPFYYAALVMRHQDFISNNHMIITYWPKNGFRSFNFGTNYCPRPKKYQSVMISQCKSFLDVACIFNNSHSENILQFLLIVQFSLLVVISIIKCVSNKKKFSFKTQKQRRQDQVYQDKRFRATAITQNKY